MYDDNSSISKRSLPLNAWPDNVIPGGVFTATEQWGGVPRRGISTGSLPLYGIPQKSTGGPFVSNALQWGAISKYSIPEGGLSLYGIPQKYIYVPPLPPVSSPPLVTVGGGGSIVGWAEEPEWKYKEKLRKRILRDDEELLEIIMAMVLSGRLN